MAPVINPLHLGLRSPEALGHQKDPDYPDYPDYPDVDLDPVARFILVFCVSFLVITTLLVLLKLAGVCLLACLIGCRASPEERVVYRVYHPVPQDVQPQARAPMGAHTGGAGGSHGDGESSDAPPPPYSPQAHKNYGSTS